MAKRTNKRTSNGQSKKWTIVILVPFVAAVLTIITLSKEIFAWLKSSETSTVNTPMEITTKDSSKVNIGLIYDSAEPIHIGDNYINIPPINSGTNEYKVKSDAKQQEEKQEYITLVEAEYSMLDTISVKKRETKTVFDGDVRINIETIQKATQLRVIGYINGEKINIEDKMIKEIENYKIRVLSLDTICATFEITKKN